MRVLTWKETDDEQLDHLLLRVMYFCYNYGKPLRYHRSDSINIFLLNCSSVLRTFVKSKENLYAITAVIAWKFYFLLTPFEVLIPEVRAIGARGVLPI